MKTFLSYLMIGGALLTASRTQADEATQASLREALTHHASFDTDLTADFSIDHAEAFQRQKGIGPKFAMTDSVHIVPGAGKYGAALHFSKKSNAMPAYQGDKITGYNAEDWSTTVSLWIRLTPDEDLEPGYCDPIQIIGDDMKKGFIFLEWSKDHVPRYFRYAARPILENWDPQGIGWEELPEDKRPMVQLKKAPFSRDRWTHAVFTIEHFNTDAKRSKGTLYLDGVKQGEIKNWDMRYTWPAEAVKVVLGVYYIGYLDDLSIYNRALTDQEVQVLYKLPEGVKSLGK